MTLEIGGQHSETRANSRDGMVRVYRQPLTLGSNPSTLIRGKAGVKSRVV